MGKNDLPTRRIDSAVSDSAHETANQRKVERQLRLLDPALLKPALVASLTKLHPRTQLVNPVMFVVYIGSILTTLLWFQSLDGRGEAPSWFILSTAVWLWFTVLFANFAEALAEGRSKAQAASLRTLKKDTWAKRFEKKEAALWHGGKWLPCQASSLRKGDVVFVETKDLIPLDGEVIEGVASVDESAITGESAPVVRESGGDFSSVTGGTRVLSDWIVVRIMVNPGESFLDRMISMVEGAKRQKTPNEIALTILLVALTIVFLLVTVTLLPYSMYSVDAMKAGSVVSITALIALLVCLIPTTIGGLLSAVGVAGMSRMMQANVIATSGRAVEAAGDVDVLLLDKTGTITYGNRQASAFTPAPGVSQDHLARAALLASLADETPEGRSIVDLAKRMRVDDRAVEGAVFLAFSAHTRMSGADLPVAGAGPRALRKGAGDAIRKHVESHGGVMPADVSRAAEEIGRRGSTPLVVCEDAKVLGVVELKDIVKSGIRERFAELRRMGIKTIMVTGDNKLTAAAIAAEAGVDDFLAEATPEAKLKLIREYQAQGRLIAMTGDGTNDAPALAQADVAVVMNSGTQAAKEAGNMVDLDSDPTKLLEVVETGKALLMTRGSLTTFSIANDIAKYFAIIPAMFVGVYPQLNALNVMHLASPQSAILSAVIFNALIIVFLIPLALKGVRFRAIGAAALLRRNLAIYGLGGILVPFVGIKLIDVVLAAIGMV
jgi:potassium-transporting ATPase ATP-binding subunit